MRLVKGDGLFWLGRLFSQRGHWARAESLYAKAASEFKDEFTEKWLSSRISLSFVKNASGSQDSSILLDLKEYIENNNLHSLYKSHYSTVLLNIAANMFTTEFKGDLTNVKRLIKEGLRYGQESLSGANLSHAFELLGDVLFTERDYQAALKNYMTAYNLVTNQSGDILTTISVLLSSAKCLSHLNQEDAAFELLEQAKILAQRFENKELQYRVFLAYQSNLKWNSVLYLDIMNDALRTSNENEKGSFLRDMEDCHKTIFDYLDNPSESSFNQIQTELDLLGRNRYSPPLLSYIRFLKSNLHLFHLKLNRRIIAFHHAPDSFKKQIDEIHLNFNPMTYDRTLNKINSLLEEYHNLPSVRKDLLFFKSNIFRRKGLYQKEIEVLQNYVEIFPDDDPIIEHNLGVAWLNLSKYNSAKEHLLKAIDLMDGLYPLAIYNLCKTCIYLKDYEVAKYQKERLRKLGVPDSWLRDLPV
jgi:tetratricopeptide (TPR) repeat protein